MKNLLILALALTLSLFGLQLAHAGADEADEPTKIVVALTTDDFGLPETDISHLAIGDAETIHTDSGKTIDLLRTKEGVEIYVDGELVDTGLAGMRDHDGHEGIHKRIKIICDGEDDAEACDELTLLEDGDIDLDALHGEEHETIIIRKLEADGEDGLEIDEDVDVHTGEDGRKIILIRKTGEEI